ncbi:hypothetical protein C8Q80DRAFT_1187444 [Daedaleopsis nitida]|nr:hypothetical protein C8Q80DRAFT_1187444 [Daedaleopsis nitida]
MVRARHTSDSVGGAPSSHFRLLTTSSYCAELNQEQYLNLSAATAGYAQVNIGDVVFFDPGLGSCGFTNTQADFVGNVDHLTFDNFPGATANPNLNPLCGRSMVVSSAGKSVTVELVGSCLSCSLNEIELSPAAFQQLAPLSVGRIHGAAWMLV